MTGGKSRRPAVDTGSVRLRGLAPFAITWHRVRARPGRSLLVSIGVAVAVAFLVGVAGGSVLSEDLALRHSLGGLPPAERVVRAAWSGSVAPGGYTALSRDGRRAVRSLTGEPIVDAVELTDVNLGHGLVKLGASDSLRSVVDLRSGRLPRGCNDTRCEVLQISGTRLDKIDDYGVHLVVVGRGTLSSLVAFGEGGLSTQSTAGGERPEPVLLSGSVEGLAHLGPLRLFNRSYSWSAPLAPDTVHVWDIQKLFAAEGKAEARLIDENGQFILTTPDDALSTSKTESESASRRVLLVGSSAAMLLLAFAGITAGALRRDARAELRRLIAHGATRAQQRAFLLAEASAAVLPGALVGVGLGALADVLIARQVGVSAAAAIGHGVATGTTGALALAAAIGAVVAVIFALRELAAAPTKGVRPVDMAALGALVALGLLLVIGQNDASGLHTGPAVALAAMPLLASFAFCVILGRLLSPLVRVALRTARDGPLSLLVALLTLQRSPGRTAGIVGFLAVSTGLAMFGLSYRATLASSNAQRAAYSVPLDYTLGIGQALVAPNEVATSAQYDSLGPGVGSWPILRQAAAVAGSNGKPDTPTVLGVPSGAFGLLHGWRSDFGVSSPARLGRLLQPAKPVALAGARIPAMATRLELYVRDQGAVVQPELVVLTPRGEADQLALPLATAQTGVLGVAVPPADRGGRVVGLAFDLPSAVAKSAAHQEAEGHNVSIGFAGTLQLGPLEAITQSGKLRVSSFAGWIGHAGISPRRAGSGVRVRFQINTAAQALLRPRQPFDDRRLAVVASPDVAASAGPGGAIELNFGDQVVHARLVGTLSRFPTTQDADESFVVADEASLATALGANDLPTAIPDELWLSVPPAAQPRVAASLREPPYSTLAISSRAAIASSLRDDPLGRGIVVSLLSASIAALALALVGLALVTAGFLRDDGDTLFDLESQGVGPSTLRASVRWRALGLAAIGLVAGIVLGAALVAITGRLLALDATLTLPDPPLQRVTPWLAIGVSACALAFAAAALVEVVLRLIDHRSAAGRGLTGESWAA